MDRVSHQNLPTTATQLQLVVGQSSSAGIKPENQDAIGLRLPSGNSLAQKGVVAVISDGVSCAESGREAAAISVQNFIADYYSTPATWSVQTACQRVLTALNRWLYDLGKGYRAAHHGYVCTFSALIIKSCLAHFVHIGDSRLYRFRDGELLCLTRDHATQLKANGDRHLTRALGLSPELEVDYGQFALQVGDIYLTMTDGIYEVISDKQLSELLKQLQQNSLVVEFTDAQCQQWTEELIAQALVAGSQDNLSCQLLAVQSLPKANLQAHYSQLSIQPFPPPLSEGQRFDGYQVERILHQSTRSQVYLVKDAQGRLACMKTPSVNFEDDLGYIERFMMESWIAARIHNSHVLKLVDTQKHKSALYYLTEYHEGMTLSQWLSHYPQPSLQQVLDVMKQLEKGVRAFHRQDVIHQDLKPDNIILNREGRVIVIDFGACVVKGVEEESLGGGEGNPLGTADYSAPEVVLAGQTSIRSDVFSLGVICYELLTGQRPYLGKLADCRSQNDFFALKYQSVTELNPLLPTWLDAPLQQALSIHAEQRQQDTHEFLYQLQHPQQVVRQSKQLPLLQRHPVRFWRAIATIELLLICIILFA